ncbi:hypothetical protein IWQ60_009661 [Tieghemiomyces parasiticus]|uniref:Uncharacterized protein n=1 Tax=Tieghemiomyces parasiticus TaxID=78921 RepID=A0A9W7ZTA1_9FUNG|nr:hypothetical protein IWQ60_009661 [Tieghemiomyces parasiticus]
MVSLTEDEHGARGLYPHRSERRHSIEEVQAASLEPTTPYPYASPADEYGRPQMYSPNGRPSYDSGQHLTPASAMYSGGGGTPNTANPLSGGGHYAPSTLDPLGSYRLSFRPVAVAADPTSNVSARLTHRYEPVIVPILNDADPSAVASEEPTQPLPAKSATDAAIKSPDNPFASAFTNSGFAGANLPYFDPHHPAAKEIYPYIHERFGIVVDKPRPPLREFLWGNKGALCCSVTVVVIIIALAIVFVAVIEISY